MIKALPKAIMAIAIRCAEAIPSKASTDASGAPGVVPTQRSSSPVAASALVFTKTDLT